MPALKPASILGLLVLSLFILIAIFAPWLAPHTPDQTIGMSWDLPGPGSILGTDNLGRDLLSRLIWGTRVSLGVTALAALVGGHVLSRLWPLLIVRSLPHVGDTAQSKSKPLADQITGAALVAAFLWCFVPLAVVWQAQSALFLIASAGCSGLAAAWMGRWFARRLQGFTGDCLGATQQVSEIGFYLGAALALRWA